MAIVMLLGPAGCWLAGSLRTFSPGRGVGEQPATASRQPTAAMHRRNVRRAVVLLRPSPPRTGERAGVRGRLPRSCLILCFLNPGQLFGRRVGLEEALDARHRRRN